MSDQIDYAEISKIIQSFSAGKKAKMYQIFSKQLEELIKNKVALLIANCYIICSIQQSGAGTISDIPNELKKKNKFTGYTPFSP